MTMGREQSFQLRTDFIGAEGSGARGESSH